MRSRLRLRSAAPLVVLAALAAAWPARSSDWPQFQRDAGRTGRTADAVAPPYRARWIWMGPTLTLRNAASVPGWPDDLTSREGYSFPMPQTVPFTIAESVQPVVAAGRVFVGTMEGDAYAISATDGATLWHAALPGGTIVSAAWSSAAGGTVLFVTVTGQVLAFDGATGATRWSYDVRRAVTSAPLEISGAFYLADHAGFVHALDAATGHVLWRQRLAGPVAGGIAGTTDSIYSGSEDMTLSALDRATGAVRAAYRLPSGQSFRLTTPVVYGGTVWVQVATLPVVGSEYVMEQVMADATSLAAEEDAIARWLIGDTNGGRWTDASHDWNHLYALRATDLAPRFRVLDGPVGGCGHPAENVTVDNAGRVLTWWKTRYPTLTKLGTFGSNYSIDLAAVDQATGRRITIDNGHFSSMWLLETDNLYALSVAGDRVWMHQRFRGTQVIRPADSTSRIVQVEVRHRDGGNFDADVAYGDLPRPEPTGGNFVEAAQDEALGHVAPVIVDDRVYLAERFGVTALEHAP